MPRSTKRTKAGPKTKSRAARRTRENPWNGLPEEFEDIFSTPVELGISLFKKNLAQPILSSLDGEWLPTGEEISEMTECVIRAVNDTLDETTGIIQGIITHLQMTDVRNILNRLGELNLLRQMQSIWSADSVADGQGGNPRR